ncbi:MAG: BamA/TamA family outer membrane protein [Acidobacteriota bacterium]|nr:BamA/TamA family outer membrane protein [Acidobacteriota bacterium]
MRSSIPFLLCASLLAVPAAAQTLPTVTFDAPAPQDPAPRDVPKAGEQGRLDRLLERLRPFIKSSPKKDGFRRGFYPKFGSVTTGGGVAAGPGYRYEGIGDGPVDADVFARASWQKYWQVEGRLSLARLDEGRRLLRAFTRVRDMPREDFFGFGSDSLEDDRVSYGLREAVIGALAQQQIGTGLRLHGGVEMVWPSTREGADDSLPSIEEVFDTTRLPGFRDESDFLVLRGGGSYDRTDAPGNPTRGPQHLAEFARWQARGGSGVSFNTLQLDLRQFVPLFGEGRVLALRAALSQATPSSGGEVPLYYQPWLGGGKAMRGYRSFRFRDRAALVTQAEYRHHLFSFLDGDVQIGGVAYAEAGAVGRSAGNLGDFISDYGVGIRAGNRDGMFFRLEGVFGGGDGNRVLVKFGNAF